MFRASFRRAVLRYWELSARDDMHLATSNVPQFPESHGHRSSRANQLRYVSNVLLCDVKFSNNYICVLFSFVQEEIHSRNQGWKTHLADLLQRPRGPNRLD